MVDDLNVVGPVRLPDKADAVPVIDANAVLSFPAALQPLKVIAGRDAQIVERFRGLELIELAESDGRERCEPATPAREEQIGRLGIPEADDHTGSI